MTGKMPAWGADRPVRVPKGISANIGFWLLYHASGIYRGFPVMLAPTIPGSAALIFTRTRRQSAIAVGVLVASPKTRVPWVVSVSTIRALGYQRWFTGTVPLAG